MEKAITARQGVKDVDKACMWLSWQSRGGNVYKTSAAQSQGGKVDETITESQEGC